MTQLVALIARALQTDPQDLTAGSAMHEVPTWNSLTHIELIVSLEQAFEIELTEDEIVAMTTVGDIRIVLQARGLAVE